MTATRVFVRTGFTGFHRWPEAPTEVAFLRNLHRHVFFVELIVNVTADRQVEFYLLQAELNKVCAQIILPALAKDQTLSCESMATMIFSHFSKTYLVYRVQISEDNENGAYIEQLPHS